MRLLSGVDDDMMTMMTTMTMMMTMTTMIINIMMMLGTTIRKQKTRKGWPCW
jgi:hypothetical protein